MKRTPSRRPVSCLQEEEEDEDDSVDVRAL